MKAKVPYILLILLALCLLSGILIGEVPKVIETAVTLCLGCIGIG